MFMFLQLVIRRAALGDHDTRWHPVPDSTWTIHVPTFERWTPHGEATMLQLRDVSFSPKKSTTLKCESIF